jgi:putative membrane protein
MHSTHTFIRRHQLLALSVAFGVALLAPMEHALAQAAASVAGGARSLDSADHKFVEDAAQGGMAEVALGQLAQQRGSHAQVKAFGQRMVDDHTKANDDLKRMASAKKLELPSTSGAAHRLHADQLGTLSGTEFDRAYVKHMLNDHQKVVSDFEKAAKSAKDPDVKAFAARTLPTLQAHLRLAQTTYDAVK